MYHHVEVVRTGAIAWGVEDGRMGDGSIRPGLECDELPAMGFAKTVEVKGWIEVPDRRDVCGGRIPDDVCQGKPLGTGRGNGVCAYPT